MPPRCRSRRRPAFRWFSATAAPTSATAWPLSSSSRSADRRGRPSSRTNPVRHRNLRWHRLDRPAQLGAQFLGNEVRIDAVANDLRPDEDDELGAHDRLVLVREDVADLGDLIEDRDAVAIDLGAFLDQAGQQHRLPARDRDRALDLALRDGRHERTLRAVRDLADLLLDI